MKGNSIAIRHAPGAGASYIHSLQGDFVAIDTKGVLYVTLRSGNLWRRHPDNISYEQIPGCIKDITTGQNDMSLFVIDKNDGSLLKYNADFLPWTKIANAPAGLVKIDALDENNVIAIDSNGKLYSTA